MLLYDYRLWKTVVSCVRSSALQAAVRAPFVVHCLLWAALRRRLLLFGLGTTTMSSGFFKVLFLVADVANTEVSIYIYSLFE